MILIWVKSPAFRLLNSVHSLDVPKCETIVEETWMKHGNKQHGLKSTNHKPWPFELVEVNMCFLGGLLRWLTEQKKKFANTQRDITNLALSTFAIALFSALWYCNSIVIFLRHKMLWQSEQTANQNWPVL